jgi:hypothetical protein
MSAVRRRRRGLWAAALALGLPAAAAAFYLGWTALSLGAARLTQAAPARPSAISLTGNVPARRPLAAPPPATTSSVGLDPNQLVYSGSQFRPDAIRILDVAALQVSLSRYWAGSGRYPDTLAALFPTWAPLGPDGQPLASPPLDPETRAPYAYSAVRGGLDYRLSARLSNGHTYTGSPHATS